MSLFSSSSSRSQSKNLVEFRAGKMTMRGNMVHPDKRKGLVYIHQSSDSLIHFCWKDRQSGSVEDDWIIFPDDCEYVRVPQCTTGRVFLLKFKSSNKKTFFWMQEPKTDKDETYCRKVNEYLNNPPTPGSQSGRGGSNLGSERDLQSLLSSMSQQQLMQLFGNVGGMSGLSSLLVPSDGNMRSGSSSRSRSSGATSGSASQARSAAAIPPAAATSAPVAAATTPSSATVGSNLPATPLTTGVPSLGNLTNLQQILSGIQVPDSPPGRPEKPSVVDLSEGLSTDVLHPILNNADFMRQLRDFLPPSDQASEGDTASMVRDTVQSPQFAQALSVFSAALQSGQLGPLIQQFGLGSEAVEAAQKGDMEAFIAALQNKDKKKEEGDDGMALD
ncbi:proteasomal ubiquitin receptor ADRM1-like isoform X1 [Daphnia pulicaria]|uniref:proteasomal ubiquitin receptor ADRM1-like isoform X1 n=1 Tax=Daphnia pulicaria TaxID=35523 RepID=UPI001EEBA222|nr:proteasomal ubiquitin receptor ADRM1-like isoform X1 [Daphnia pulicaria]